METVMNWDAIGAIAEGVGSIAVVVTLAYLAVQMRVANKQRELESVRDMHTRWDQFCESLSHSTERASIINRGRKSLSNLNEDERLIFEAVHYQLLNTFEAWYMQLMGTSKPGAHRDQQLDNIVAGIKTMFDYPGARKIWESHKHMYVPVQQIIDDTLSANEADED
jgi:hypothetical protein